MNVCVCVCERERERENSKSKTLFPRMRDTVREADRRTEH